MDGNLKRRRDPEIEDDYPRNKRSLRRVGKEVKTRGLRQFEPDRELNDIQNGRQMSPGRRDVDHVKDENLALCQNRPSKVLSSAPVEVQDPKAMDDVSSELSESSTAETSCSVSNVDCEEIGEDSDYPHSEHSSEWDAVTEDSSDLLEQRRPDTVHSQTPNLQTRLATFLPHLRRANQDLEHDGNALARRIDAVADDESHYIEMNLGLGVLKARNKTAYADVRIDDSTSSEGSSTANEEINEKSPQDFQEDVMTTLRGSRRKGVRQRTMIQQIGDE